MKAIFESCKNKPCGKAKCIQYFVLVFNLDKKIMLRTDLMVLPLIQLQDAQYSKC